jgi:hypothetical protein
VLHRIAAIECYLNCGSRCQALADEELVDDIICVCEMLSNLATRTFLDMSDFNDAPQHSTLTVNEAEVHIKLYHSDCLRLVLAREHMVLLLVGSLNFSCVSEGTGKHNALHRNRSLVAASHAISTAEPYVAHPSAGAGEPY